MGGVGKVGGIVCTKVLGQRKRVPCSKVRRKMMLLKDIEQMGQC